MKNKKRTLLWEIGGNELPGFSYLFGTMHVQDGRIFEAAEKSLDKIRACECFAAEFHLEDAKTGINPTLSQLADNQKLSQFVPAKKYQKLRRILLKTTGFDLDFLQQASPFAIVNLLTGQILQSDIPVSLDEYLWDFAKQEGKSMHGIETLQEQLEVLNKIPMQDQVEMLLDMGRNVKRFRHHLLHVTELYQEGDLQGLFKSVKKNSKGLRKLLLYQRNEIMAERIAKLVQQQMFFTAIGVAHLGGEKGVIHLLKLKGLTVRPVR